MRLKFNLFNYLVSPVTAMTFDSISLLKKKELREVS